MSWFQSLGQHTGQSSVCGVKTSPSANHREGLSSGFVGSGLGGRNNAVNLIALVGVIPFHLPQLGGDVSVSL